MPSLSPVASGFGFDGNGAKTLRGDYVAAGTGLGGSSPAITIGTIPAGSTIEAAFLYWGFLDANRNALPSTTITFDGYTVTGNLIGSRPFGPNAKLPYAVAYRADVKSFVDPDSGRVYRLNISTPASSLPEGASLVVIYSNPTLPIRTVILLEGNDPIYTPAIATTPITGFIAPVIPARVDARTTFIVGDGDNNKYDQAYFGSTNPELADNDDNYFEGADGGNWDTVTQDVSRYVTVGGTSTFAGIGRKLGHDLLYWVAQVFSVGSAGVTVTQTDGSTDVTEAGGTDTFTVVLDSKPSANVVVSTTISDSQQNVNNNQLTFTPANWSTPQAITVTAFNDNTVEQQHTGIVTLSVTSSESKYNGIFVSDITVNIADNDDAGVGIIQSGGSTNVAEGNQSDAFTVFLSTQPTADVVVTVTPDASIAVVPSTLTFTPGNWSQTQAVTVTAVNDSVAQSPRIGLITASSTSANYNFAATTIVSVSVIDNDTAGVTILATDGNTTVAEGGSLDTYTIVLTSTPTADVSISLAAAGQVTVSTSILTFTPSNWSVAQTVTLTAINDAVAQGLQVGTITHAATSSDASYNNISIATLAANIADNDFAGVHITQSGSSTDVAEGGSSDTYTVVLTSMPTANVSIALSPDGFLTVPSTVVFTAVNWNTAQTVTVAAIDDQVSQRPHLASITHIASSTDASYNGIRVASLSVNISDNDPPLADGVSVDGSVKADRILVTFMGLNVQMSVNGRVSVLTAPAQVIINSGDGADQIQIVNPTVPVTIIGGAGADQVFVSGGQASNIVVLDESTVTIGGVEVGLWDVESLVVNGGASSDLFTVIGLPAFPVALKGGAGADSIIGPEGTSADSEGQNTWVITAANGGLLDGSVTINGIENWTGGTGSDAFVFVPGKSLTGQLDGGGGLDVLDYSAWTAPVTLNLQSNSVTATKGVRNIGGLIAGKGSGDKIIGPDAASSWAITGVSKGTVGGLFFQNVENLTGGALDDTFLFADGQGVKGKIDGGAGKDVLDYSACLSQQITVNLQAKTATNSGGFLNLEAFQGSLGSADTFIGLNKTSTWNLSGPGSGDAANFAFANFENLTGGSGIDSFLMKGGGRWAGLLNGGSGKDVLQAFNGQTNFWVNTAINAGSLNGGRFIGVEVRI